MGPKPFHKVVSASLTRRFPEALAVAGDNVGLTIDTLREVERGACALILLCVDLTEQVLSEAVASHADFIVTYSPMPHSPLVRVSTEDVMGRILLRCAHQQLAVHSIHTASDSAAGGINDWLARSLARGATSPIVRHPHLADAGQGRLLECEVATPLSALVERLKQLLGIRFVRLALGATVDEQALAKAQEACFVKTVALQVGEGAPVLRSCAADVFITSEMSHTDVVAANAQGVIVILVGQSSMERAFLTYLRQSLEAEFTDSDWNVKVRCVLVDANPLAVV